MLVNCMQVQVYLVDYYDPANVWGRGKGGSAKIKVA